MSEREDYEHLADDLDHEADRLQHEADKLGDDIAGAREDWEHKRADDGVPGAVPRQPGDETAADGTGATETETDRD